MTALNVWKCILIYRSDSAKQILKLYGQKKNAIVGVLGNYGGKGSYHGHAKGKSGDPEAPDATAHLNTAVAYLLNNVPKQDTGQSSSKGPDKAKKGASQDATARLLALIAGEQNMGKLKLALTAENPDWEKNRLAKAAYDPAQREKKKRQGMGAGKPK